MNEEARRKLVYVASRASGRAPSTVFSHHAGAHTHMSGSGDSFYDHSSGEYFSSTYDFGSGSHWNLTLNGSNFSGYNFGSGDHFSGSISGGNVTFYDYGTGEWYHYIA